jgi:GntR family transcriptional regulator
MMRREMETPLTNARGPLYVRVYEEIAARIAAGSLPRGGQLPPEREFCQEMGVSRATVRRAIAALEEEGLIQAIQGRGTFVTAPRLVEPPNTLLSFTQLAEDRGTEAGARVLRSDVRPSTLAEADRFRTAPGSPVFDLERLRTMDELPIAIDHSIVLLAAAPGLPDADWNQASLYELLAKAGSAPARADYDVEARAADAHWADILEVSVGAPLLIADTSSYDRDERLIEIGRIIYRGDRYRFRSTLVAQRSLPPSWPTHLR